MHGDNRQTLIILKNQAWEISWQAVLSLKWNIGGYNIPLVSSVLLQYICYGTAAHF
jgi:hypothetical protein